MAGARQLRRVLAQRGFRDLYVARLTSQAADGIFQACLVSYVLFSPQRATSAGAIAASLAIVLLPFSVVGPFAGVVLDRLSRQRVLVVSSLTRAAVLAAIVVLIAAGRTGVDFYVAALAVFSVNRFVLAALSAGLPVVVPADDLVTANSLSTTSGTVATLLGAGIGSGARGLIGADDTGVAIVAGIAGLAYLAAAATATRAGRNAFGPLDPRPWDGVLGELRTAAREMADGGAHLWSATRARAGLAALTASRACYGLSFVATILLYRNTFTHGGGGLPGLAAVVSVSVAGSVIGAVVTPRATTRLSKEAWVVLVLVGAGLAETAFGLPFSPGWFLLGAPVLGFSAQAAKICVDTMVQESVDDAYRGRAFSIYDLLFNVAYVLAAAVGALALPPSGKSYLVLVVGSAGYVVAGLVYWAYVVRARSVSGGAATPATAGESPVDLAPQAGMAGTPDKADTGDPAEGELSALPTGRADR